MEALKTYFKAILQLLLLLSFRFNHRSHYKGDCNFTI